MVAATMFATYYIDGLLRQSSAAQARAYLGIEPFTPVTPPEPSSDWGQTVTKRLSQSVVSTDNFQNDNELLLTIVPAGFYLVELLLLYSGNSAQGDYQGRIRFPSLGASGSAMGYFNAFSSNMTPSLTAVQQGDDTHWPANGAVIGVSGTIEEQLCCQVRFLLKAGAGGLIQYEFANGNGADGRTVITRAGSTFRLQRLS